jgi:hypothetical protein
VIQIQQHLQGLLDDGVGLFALDINDETYAAGFVFELRIVKPLLWRWRSSRPALVLFLLHAAGHCLGSMPRRSTIFYSILTRAQ